MENEKHPLDTLNEIRSIMEKSSKFISLSGLSGIFAGVFALLGASAFYFYFNDFYMPRYAQMGVYSREDLIHGKALSEFITFIFADGIIVLVLALSSALYFTRRKALRYKLSMWDATAKRFYANTLMPLAVGGIFCIALAYHGQIYLIAPATLIFYGLALINASKYSLNDIRYLGLCEIGLGLIASFFGGFGLIFWALGFGVLHIIYGIVMYSKYEK